MQTREKSNRLVAGWLLVGVGMTIVQIALGGITRLTGSGLSITQWDVITGSLPPLSEQQWMTEFAKYRQTPQFQILNFEFTLADFKFIFFWEWFHRLWARTIGLVFVIGFIWFFAKRHFKKEMINPLLILFFLGALQGAVGWIMVASGLTGDAVYVKPTRLALHFIFALGLLSYCFWFALQLLVDKKEQVVQAPLRKWNMLILCLVVIQLLYGALMAGHKAATAASTWPTINGEWVPESVIKNGIGIRNFVDNSLLIHLIHRSLAYIIFVLIVLWTVKIRKTVVKSTLLTKTQWLPLVLVLVQVALGIISLVTSKYIKPGKWGAFEWAAQLHQLIGMTLLLSLIWMLFIIRGKSTTTG